MTKADIHPMPEYFDRYIHLVDEVELSEAFQRSQLELQDFDWQSAHNLGKRTYAPGKWSVSDILQHLLDWERIMTFRAILFVRNTGVKAQGLDQDIMARQASLKARPVPQLVEEMQLLRPSTACFFNGLEEEDLQKSGISSGAPISVLALGCTILGHQRHHFKILKEQYLNLH